MPSSDGVYSLPPGYLAIDGGVIEISQHSPPLEDIAAALTLRLSRDGTALWRPAQERRLDIRCAAATDGRALQ
jgi:hypothetical protein